MASSPFPVRLGTPGGDVGAGGGHRRVMPAHVVGERAAAAGGWRDHHVIAHAGQQPDGRGVDGGREHLLRAAGEQGDPPAASALGAVHAVDRLARRQPGGRQVQHRAQAAAQHARRHGAAERPYQAGRRHRHAEAARARQDAGQQPAQQPLVPGAGVGLLDVAAAVVDQVHVVHAGRASRHAGQAAEAAVHVLDHVRGGGATGFEHVLHQVDAAARTIQFVAEQHEGRAGGRAHAAMYAGAEHAVGGGGLRVTQLLGGEVGLQLRLLRRVGRD